MLRIFVVVMMLAPTYLWAYQNEPSGYEGHEWGTPFENMSENMQLIQETNIKIYNKQDDALTFQEVKVAEKIYAFYEDKFAAVMMRSIGAAESKALLNAFEAEYGFGKKPDIRKDLYFWMGGTTTIMLSCNPPLDICIAMINSTQLKQAMEENAQK